MAEEQAPYRIVFAPAAQRQFKKLKGAVRTVIVRTLSRLGQDPFAGETRTLKGFPRLRRARADRFRIIYEVLEEEHALVVLLIKDRRDAYRRLQDLN